MYASPSSPLSTHRSGLVSCSNMYCIDPKLESKPVPERLSAHLSHLCPPTLCVHVLISIMAMMDYWHLTNMTGCHRSLSRDFQTMFPLELTIIEIVY